MDGVGDGGGDGGGGEGGVVDDSASPLVGGEALSCTFPTKAPVGYIYTNYSDVERGIECDTGYGLRSGSSEVEKQCIDGTYDLLGCVAGCGAVAADECTGSNSLNTWNSGQTCDDATSTPCNADICCTTFNSDNWEAEDSQPTDEVKNELDIVYQYKTITGRVQNCTESTSIPGCNIPFVYSDSRNRECTLLKADDMRNTHWRRSLRYLIDSDGFRFCNPKDSNNSLSCEVLR